MSIREDIVTSAVTFLQDPNVATSPVENKLSFLRSKNLTQEEIDAAFARAGSAPPTPAQHQQAGTVPVQTQQPPQQAPPQPYYGGQQVAPQPYGWQPPAPPPVPPKRDWRDWFIMATVLGGVSYGIYFIGKRYLYPLVSPPTPEKLDQDKASVDEQFEKAFASLEQLAKDTEALKTSEQDRTEKLDKVLEELEGFMRDAKSNSRRHDDEADRLRDEMKSVKDMIPKSMQSQKDATDTRLREIGTEVKSLRSLIGQRLSNPAPAPSASPAPADNAATPRAPMANPLRATVTPANDTPASPAETPKVNGSANDKPQEGGSSVSSPAPQAASNKQDYISSLGDRSSPFGAGASSGSGKASIPAWQLAASNAGSSS